MTIAVTSLGGLKCALRTPNVQVRVLEHWQEDLRNTTRTPIRKLQNGKPGVQTNGFYFAGRDQKGVAREMWCPFPKLVDLHFNANGSVTFFPQSPSHSWTLLFEVQNAR